MKTYQSAAVLTGDLIKSSALSPAELDLAFDQLRTTAGILENLFKIDLHFTRFRGDGWQVFLEQADMAHDAALAFRAGVKSLGKSFDTRVSIGYGDASLPGVSLEDGTGSAFIESGRGLDDMAKSGVFAAFGKASPCLPLFQAISSDWTVKQAQVAHASILATHPTLTELAQFLGVTVQTVSQHFEAAHLEEVIAALKLLYDYPQDPPS